MEYDAQSKVQKLIGVAVENLEWDEIEDAKGLTVIHRKFLYEGLKVARNNGKDIALYHARDSLSFYNIGSGTVTMDEGPDIRVSVSYRMLKSACKAGVVLRWEDYESPGRPGCRLRDLM
ncbi:hypothetical protein BPAE_0007g00170 [Botrytis paeoniae]|uniref:Uncharacterized protein n=1 Tax=Botrytis paeoniae TaxID=278948 RepID=A0A4Z1G7L5_9HELO|nr:hypothetical protein BPAE_0007g00170 [Botrytis paeoniae]